MSRQGAGGRLRIVGMATHNSGGGAQVALRKLMNALSVRGHRTELWFLYRTRGDQETEALEARLLFPRPAHGVSSYLGAALALLRALREEPPDVLVTFLPLANVLGQTLAVLAGVPARVASQRNPGWANKRPMQMMDKIAGTIGIYGRTVCVSNAVRNSFENYPAPYRRRLMVVSNGLELQESTVLKTTARVAFGLPIEAFIVVAVGRLYAPKNLDLLLTAVARAPEVLLVLVGDGEDRHRLEAYVQALGVTERVVFLGQLPAARVPELLNAADVFAQPSIYEGQSNALLEALAAGLPVLASDIPAQRETLTDGATEPCGLLLPLDDPESWAEALQRLAKDRRARENLGRAAARRSRAFTVDQMAAGFEAAIVAAARAGKHAIEDELNDRRHSEWP